MTDDISTLVGSYPTCAICGGTKVTRDAWAVWNSLTCDWSLGAVFDAFFCDTCGECRLDWQIDETFRTSRIRRLNDDMRHGDLKNGTVVVTQGVRSLGETRLRQAAQAVAEFDAFGEDNDPHQEHDFGAIDLEGQTLFWKIDYFDRAMERHSPDAANPEVTHRVLTLMLASEY